MDGNNVVTGMLPADPVMEELVNGMLKATFDLGTEDGTYRVTAWERVAQKAMDDLRKGQTVAVTFSRAAPVAPGNLTASGLEVITEVLRGPKSPLTPWPTHPLYRPFPLIPLQWLVTVVVVWGSAHLLGLAESKPPHWLCAVCLAVALLYWVVDNKDRN